MVVFKYKESVQGVRWSSLTKFGVLIKLLLSEDQKLFCRKDTCHGYTSDLKDNNISLSLGLI